jgi:type IV pilus assembly protein PilX
LCAINTYKQGATLVIALIFLIILTLLGTNSGIKNTLQERMANNTRSRDVAFQAAELALQHADRTLNADDLKNYYTQCNSGVDPSSNDGIRCQNDATMFTVHRNDNMYWYTNLADCTSDDVIVVDVQAQFAEANIHLASNPCYVIEVLPTHTQVATETEPEITYYYYRVTARGISHHANVAVLLQTLYQYPPSD